MIDAHLRKLRARGGVHPADEAALCTLVDKAERLPANRVLARAGEPAESCILVLGGWVARSKQVDGAQRQIISIALPGDFVDLHGLTLGRIDHDVISLTQCKIGRVDHARLRLATTARPELQHAYLLAASVDAAIQREWSACLGSRSAISRVAHLFCELFLRLEIVGCTDGQSCDFPLTQTQIAECIGVTPIHVNRVIQELRSTRLINLEYRRLTILNGEALATIAKFDPAYLYVGPNPDGLRLSSSIPSEPFCVSENWPEFNGFHA